MESDWWMGAGHFGMSTIRPAPQIPIAFIHVKSHSYDDIKYNSTDRIMHVQ